MRSPRSCALGARQLLMEAVEAEIAAFLASYQDEHDQAGRQRLAGIGYLPEREIQTGIGGVPAKVPRVHDRDATNEDRLQFRS